MTDAGKEKAERRGDDMLTMKLLRVQELGVCWVRRLAFLSATVFLASCGLRDGDASNSQSRFAWKDSAGSSSCVCIPAAGSTECKPANNAQAQVAQVPDYTKMVFKDKETVVVSSRNLSHFQKIFGSTMSCSQDDKQAQTVKEHSCICSSGTCESKIPSQPVRVFSGDDALSREESKVTVSVQDIEVFKKYSPSFTCTPVYMAKTSVSVDPAGPYAKRRNAAVHDLTPSAGLSSCAALVANKASMKNTLCLESANLNKTDPKSPWARMSESAKESFANKLQDGVAKNSSWPIRYACQCQLTQRCGLSAIAAGQSMFMDTYGAFYFERAKWGFCKVY
jgi:hypothetical protein